MIAPCRAQKGERDKHGKLPFPITCDTVLAAIPTQCHFWCQFYSSIAWKFAFSVDVTVL